MHKQFDFWIGDWIVLDSLGNKVINLQHKTFDMLIYKIKT